jgi:hypothetical protein
VVLTVFQGWRRATPLPLADARRGDAGLAGGSWPSSPDPPDRLGLPAADRRARQR